MLYKSTNRAERYHVKGHLTAESEFKALIYDPKTLKPQSNTFQKTLKNMLMGFASPLILDHWICLHLFSVVLESQPNPWAHIVLSLQDSEKEVWTGQRVISKLPIQEGDTGKKDHSCPASHLPWMDPISVLSVSSHPTEPKLWLRLRFLRERSWDPRREGWDIPEGKWLLNLGLKISDGP